MYRTKYNEKLKVWSGRDLPPLYNPKVSLAQVVLDALTAYGSKIAQVFYHNELFSQVFYIFLKLK